MDPYSQDSNYKYDLNTSNNNNNSNPHYNRKYEQDYSSNTLIRPTKEQTESNGHISPIAKFNPNPNKMNINEPIRLYITLKKSEDSMIDYKKMIIMTPTNIKISMLKRQIEKEFSDLFPKENTYIVGKIDDQYGYALSNSSYIHEILHHNDRLNVYPEDLGRIGDADYFNGTSENGNTKGLNLGNDVSELLYMLKNLQQNIIQKLADSNFNKHPNLEEALLGIMPLGFSQSKVIVHNVAVILNKIFGNERLDILEDNGGSMLLNMLVTLMNYWIAELILHDNYMLTVVVELLEILIKSATFCANFKGGFIITNLMNASNMEMISTQTKSRLVKIISYLSKGEYKNQYNPINNYQYNVPARKIMERTNEGYVPSFIKTSDGTNNNNRTSRATPIRNDSSSSSKQMLFAKSEANNNNIKIYDTAESKDYDHVSSSTWGNSRPPSYQSKRYMNALDSQKGKNNGVDMSKNQRFSNAQYSNTYNPTSLKTQPGDNLMYKDYIGLLGQSNNQEMHCFAVKNLDNFIDTSIDNIMADKEDFLKCMNLIDIELPSTYQQYQLHILTLLNQAMTEIRAGDALQKGIVQRLLRSFSYQSNNLQSILQDLLQTVLIKGKYRIDLSTIISIIVSPYTRLHDFAMKVLSIISDPNIIDQNGFELQFENHIKFMIELSLSKKKSYEFKNLAITTLANLALKENLKPQIIYNHGLETLIHHLRNQENLEGQRLAAKALLNLSINSQDTRLRIITELSDEIKKLHRNELDTIIQGYIQTLLNSSK